MEDSKILDLFWQREERAIAEIEKKYRKNTFWRKSKIILYGFWKSNKRDKRK